MNPIEKWKLEGKAPWKLVLQAAKIVFVTIHLIVYGRQLNKYFKHHGNTLAAMKEMFLTEPDLSLDVLPYPPTVPNALKNRDEFYEHIDKAIYAYSVLDRGSFGVFDFGDQVSGNNPISPLTFCVESYEYGTLDPSLFYYNYSSVDSTRCINISNNQLTPGHPVSQAHVHACSN